MAGTKKVMRTELGNGTLISTVWFIYDGAYETTVYDNEVNKEELDCYITPEYEEAFEMHMAFVREYLNKAEVEEQEGGKAGCTNSLSIGQTS